MVRNPMETWHDLVCRDCGARVPWTAGRVAVGRARTAARLRDLRARIRICRHADRVEQAQRDELRAILAPVLDEPVSHLTTCVFCNRYVEYGGHVPDCPALPVNRDRLLGRDRAPAPPEERG